MGQYFDQLKINLKEINQLSSKGGAIGFFAQEALRFHSIAGTILENFKSDMSTCVDERYITHILSRSIIENYFWLLYIFDNHDERDNRYQELINSFKRDYRKLLNEELLPCKNKLELLPEQAYLPKTKDINSMLAQLKNNDDERLNYLYFIYRITSFDTHGKNLNNILETVFEKTVNFPMLDIGKVFEIIANQYIIILNNLKDENEV